MGAFGYAPPAVAIARTERLTPNEEAPAPSIRRWVVRVGVAPEPLAPPEIFSLEGVERLSIGRSHQSIEDPWLSAEHAELLVGADRIELRDLGSSNGTLVWGERRSSAALGDGDLFETGGTFWLYREMPLDKPLPEPPHQGPLATLYPPLHKELDRLRRVARTRVPIMLLGATGTGKEVLAREIHLLSKRAGPFVAINTAAVQKTLVASELFGVERGAHSMAERPRLGQIRAAEGGTLLLDEIGDMPFEVQAALLRVLQESEVVPVGGDVPVKVDVRFLCATHHDLKEMVDAGTFRADLFARLGGCRIALPDLADRPEDIGLLIARLLGKLGGERISFSPPAYRALLSYGWPLNVRELEKALEAALAFAEGHRLELRHLPEEIQRHQPEAAQRDVSEPADLEEHYERELPRLLARHKGNVSAVARSMGRSRMQIHRWLKRLALEPESFRK